MTTAIRTVTRPSLVTVGARTISANGWRIPLVEDHLEWHLAQGPSKKWCKVECMARTMFLRNSPKTRDDVRRRVAPAFKALLHHDRFLTIDYRTGPGSHGEIVAVKLFETTSGIERQFAERQINRMRAHHEVSREIFEHAIAVIGVAAEPAAAP
jgi:hypothetical protein